eukprot:1160011-Pelagomonas_calceolata.AAC.3
MDSQTSETTGVELPMGCGGLHVDSRTPEATGIRHADYRIPQRPQGPHQEWAAMALRHTGVPQGTFLRECKTLFKREHLFERVQCFHLALYSCCPHYTSKQEQARAEPGFNVLQCIRASLTASTP